MMIYSRTCDFCGIA